MPTQTQPFSVPHSVDRSGSCRHSAMDHRPRGRPWWWRLGKSKKENDQGLIRCGRKARLQSQVDQCCSLHVSLRCVLGAGGRAVAHVAARLENGTQRVIIGLLLPAVGLLCQGLRIRLGVTAPSMRHRGKAGLERIDVPPLFSENTLWL
jgi:hypothetical protein|eukprot:COSAG02_NODE_1840_length_10706_cov_224.093240_5_plen_149_part_00